jgi:hypothetical protein
LIEQRPDAPDTGDDRVDLASLLLEIPADAGGLAEACRADSLTAVSRLLASAQSEGSIRGDVTADDILGLINILATYPSQDERQRDVILKVVTAGLRVSDRSVQGGWATATAVQAVSRAGR